MRSTERKALAEVTSAILLTGIVLAANGVVFSIFKNELVASQSSILAAANEQMRNSEKLISLVYSTVDVSGNLVVQVYDFGYADTTPLVLFVDGAQAQSFSLSTGAGPVTAIGAGQPTTLTITGSSPYSSGSGHAVVAIDTEGATYEVST